MKALLLTSFLLFSLTLSASQKIQAGDLTFCTDCEKPILACNEIAVFPYADEALILLELSTKIKEAQGKEFSCVYDPFCGDGKAGLLIAYHHIAQKVWGSDLNPRAIAYAKENATLNGLEAKSCFFLSDVTKDKFCKTPQNTLWIANPPFALKAKGVDLAVMRDGGENGLTLTTMFVSKALEASQKGDVILGIGYSRMAQDGLVELEKQLNGICEPYCIKPKLQLLEGQKLWRGFNGKKEQNNPMPISEEVFALKANPENQEELLAYKKAARFHNLAGFNKLGYYYYVIFR